MMLGSYLGAATAFCLLGFVLGDCIHSGASFSNYSVWLPDPCTVCTCQEPVVLCETIRCMRPECNYNKGDFLRIPANGCCPECVRNLMPCEYRGQIVPHNADWSPEACVNCYCMDGRVSCSNVACPRQRCKPGEISQNLPGQCCPKCIPAGRSCLHSGERFQDGSEWTPLPCTKCVCRSGQSTCYPMQCPPLICPQGQRLELMADGCCPRCSGSVCKEDGRRYQDGQAWQRDPCTGCTCIGGASVCSSKQCDDAFSCDKNQKKIIRPGECCTECVLWDGACSQERPMKYNGDLWNISSCEFCSCHDGQTRCHTAVCDHIVCSQSEVLHHPPGRCCPECISLPQCEFAGLLYQEQDTWHPDACSVCNCVEGEVVCYQQTCRACPEGQVPLQVTGQCCGECKSFHCRAECSTCDLDNLGYCTQCKAGFVQHGRCMEKCDENFHPGRNGVCQECHYSCESCIGPTAYHCLSCRTSLYWRNGECVAHCGEGFYLQNDKCLECHPTCVACSGSSRSQCLSCSQSTQFLLVGECVDSCSDQYYVERRQCLACHSLCRACLPDRAGCSRCKPGLVLHQERCSHTCPAGFYPIKSGFCLSCHPSCLTCSGGARHECISCYGGAQMRNNVCRMPCPREQYLRTDGYCHDCDRGCSTCQSNLDGTASICMSCQDESLVPSGSRCVIQCQPGLYLRNGICTECGQDCFNCTSPFLCVACQHPFVLLDGRCTEDCGLKKFNNPKTNKCEACNAHCLQCGRADHCRDCSSGYYLRDGVCATSCGLGFYPDGKARNCEVNTSPPFLQILDSVEVLEGYSTFLRSNLFFLSDADTSEVNLRLYIVKPPANGQMVKIVQGSDQIMSTDNWFTMKDLEEKRIWFLHEKSSAKRGEAVIKVGDRQLFSELQSLIFQATSDNPLRLLKNEPIYAVGGETTVITLDHLNVHQASQQEEIIFTVLQGPNNGIIVHATNGSPLVTFTLEDVRLGNVGYLHDSSSGGGSDILLLQASDGYQLLNFIMTMEIRPKSSKIPVIINNKQGYVTRGNLLQLTDNLLAAKAMNAGNSFSDDIIYTLVPPTGNPKEGEIMMIVPVPSDGPGRGWEDMGDGHMAAKMFRFMQRDITEGRMWYRHKGQASDSDMFRFDVADMSQPPNILKDQEFHIMVMADETGALSAPTIAPGVHLGMTVFENQIVQISSDSLAFQDSDTPDTDLVYTITSPLSKNEGTVEHIDRPFHDVIRFTQEDINKGRVIYRPPISDVGSKEREVVFKFIVSDGQTGGRHPEQRFAIRIIPVNNMPPRFRNDNPELLVTQAGTVPVGRNVLIISDPDTDIDDLELTLELVPKNGKIEKSDGGMQVFLKKGDVFKYEELLNNVFYYSHDGSEGSLKDSFQVSVSDGVQRTFATVKISILKVDKHAPYLLSSSTQQIKVTEGGSINLDRTHLAFSDSDDPDSRLRIALASMPVHGGLFLGRQYEMLSIGNSFTQQDVNDGLVRYTADREIGSRSLYEIIYFNVSDASNNMLPNQPLTIILNPADNQPPLVLVGLGLQVVEGESAPLTSDDINVSDIDTPVSQLTIILDTAPSFGIIQNTKPGHGSEKLRQDTVTSFPLQDLLSGYICYLQSDHRNKEPVWDGFLFHVTDGINQSPTQRFNISIELTNDEAPDIITEQLFVQEGRSVTMTNASIFVMDIDSQAEDLLFTLETPPSNGDIKRKEFVQEQDFKAEPLQKGSEFTYEDILNELIIYSHNGGDDTTDSLTLHITDGDFNDTQTMRVIIGLVNDETPRVIVNRGLRIQSGSAALIKSRDLRCTDLDSEDAKIIYTLTKDPRAGQLSLKKHGTTSKLSVEGPVTSFTQADIDQGFLKYSHTPGESSGNVIFKFNVEDPDGNQLIDQSFFITVLEDRFPPKALSVKDLSVMEGSQAKITTNYLSFTDVDSEPGKLQYTLLSEPRLGHLELTDQPGFPITEFSQSDLAASSVLYVHTSSEEIYMDRFTFTVSDGSNEITRTFYLTIAPVDDSIPVVTSKGLQVQEGVRKLITEFDLKATDKDTKEAKIVFQVVQPPLHGSLDLKTNDDYVLTTHFSMEDIYENRVSYKHDGSETTEDNFSFMVSDGTNHMFMMQQDEGDTAPVFNSPQEFDISILPMDDGTPILETNLGLQFLEYTDSEVFNLISSRDLYASDIDTPPNSIMYIVSMPPKHGRLSHSSFPGDKIDSFTQADIDHDQIRYVLTENATEMQDSFMFDLIDSKPNIVPNNIFHIMWSVITFEKDNFNITETAGVIRVPVVRSGNLKQYSIVTCRTVPGLATSKKRASRPGMQDFVAQTGQVQFDEWQEIKTCTIIINDDSIYEGPEAFYVELSSPTYALLGSPHTAAISIYDVEDEPIIQFEEGVHHVNETDGYAIVTLTRTGDLSSGVSVICYTESMTATGTSLGGLESGSDYISRGKTNSYRVVFSPGVTKTTCEVKLIDDSETETTEQFELGLIEPSELASLGPVSKATVIIEGPNDESLVYLSQGSYYFDEDAGIVEVEVLRSGSDVSHSSMVWCATRLSDFVSATPGQDYIPSSSQVTFGPGQTAEKCYLTILDDDVDPRVEGNETFVVFLGSAMGSILTEPFQATVVINDTDLDIPVMQFALRDYFIEEGNGSITIPVVRTGDLSFESSVICYTRQQTARVMMDYDERVLGEASRITFLTGEQIKTCSVKIVDDPDFEADETFLLRLTQARGTDYCEARVGEKNKATITISNHNDVPTVQFEESAYSVHEPSATDQLAIIIIKIVRSGDASKESRVRASTRDGSASSGIDYNGKSLVMTFEPGAKVIEFPIDVLHNRDIEWHESFSVLLGPDDPVGAVFGPRISATITILDNEVSGSLVLPAPPMILSLLQYDDVEKGIKIDPSPGYPLICVTPCDPHYPKFSMTHSLCNESGINQSRILYRWEVAMPTDEEGSRMPFVQVSDNTVFTSVDHSVLDSIYFRPSFHVRCVAQPLHKNGNPGVPLKSNVATIGKNNGICHSPFFSGISYGYQAQSFLATLQYVGPDDTEHPNSIHISVAIPHQDGMLPLISTYPLHNLRFLLAEPIYRQQHVCSNIILPQERAPLIEEGFLHEGQPLLLHGPGFSRPYQFDDRIRENKTLNLYKHLNLKSCIWTFDAWYHMTDLVDICGGRIISDFQVRDSAQTYLTIRVPLYVSYLYATAPIGWGSLEHRTEMEFSFYYNTILWKTGLEMEGTLGGKLQVLRILIGEDGKLVIDFKTKTKFRGQYVLEHHTLPGFTSQVLAPEELDITFDLALLWGQQTYDSPHQLWRATSNYNLKDYTGQYTIELLPCSVQSTQAYSGTQSTIPCTAHQPQRFVVPISFQQTNRPVPAIYSLNTEFQLTNNRKMFLQDPTQSDIDREDFDYNGAFTIGQKIHGRVLWSSDQDLSTAYKLTIEKLYLCTGRNGYVPTFDPTGKEYGEGIQYGCIQPNPNLKYRFLILDRINRDAAEGSFNEIAFNAKFASDVLEYSSLEEIPGVDGFIMDVDPLYKVESGHQWYLQVLYVIGTADESRRFRRSLLAVIDKSAQNNVPDSDWVKTSSSKNGTNMKYIRLNPENFGENVHWSQESHNKLHIILPILAVVLVTVGVILSVIFIRRRMRAKHKPMEKKSNIEIAAQNSLRDNKQNNLRDRRSVSSIEVKNIMFSPGSRTSVRVKDINIKAQINIGEGGVGTEV